MLNTIERRQNILDRLKASGKVSVDDLAESYGVSTVTIRNDLNELHKKGLLLRSRGGAVAPEKAKHEDVQKRGYRELSLMEKQSENQAVKDVIGARIAGLIQENESLLLDSGTTTQAVARHLKDKRNVFVMTNGLNIASELCNANGVDVMVTGGALRKSSLSFYGRHAESTLEYFRFDKLILGVDGIDIAEGIVTHFEQEAHLNRIMCKVSKKIIAATDSSKFHKRGFHLIVPLEKLDILVTDSRISKMHLQVLEEKGVKTIIVPHPEDTDAGL